MKSLLQEFGKLVCALKGHLRGKLELTRCLDDGRHEKVYACPRCGAHWVRRSKGKK